MARRSLVLATVSVVALGGGYAGCAHAQAQSASAGEATLGEIVVTARRRTESLQEVPQTVNAVTNETLQKLKITNFEDVQGAVSGLTLSQGNSGFGATASLRGLSYNVFTTNSPTVATYLNDAPVMGIEIFQSLFDIGQIEVLKGPQGTMRGVAAPSGAITVTTHKPDLSEFGGYASAQVTDLQGRNVQGAINVPIIKDVLGVRVAGVLDQTDFDGVRSIHNSLRPYTKTIAERVSVSFEPTDRLNANLTYQHLDRTQGGFQQVTGLGDGTAVNPPISAGQRAAVQDAMTTFRQHIDLVTAQVDSRIFGQHLSYVGSYQFFKIPSQTSVDTGNVLPGADLLQSGSSTSQTTTQEIRIASDPAPGRFFDYTVGAYYSWQTPGGSLAVFGPAEPGAFGSPASAPTPSALNSAYVIPLVIGGPGFTQETSLFGSVTLHLGPNTELSGGIRHIASIVQSQTTITLGNARIALPASFFGGQCAASTYARFCDVNIPGGSVVSNASSRFSSRPNIYNVSLSHHLTRDLLVYANTGTSFRAGSPSIGIQGELANSSDPVLNSLSFHPPETSRAYEVGFKSTFMDGRARINVSFFRQRFHNLTMFDPGINYFNTVTNAATLFDFTATVDALIQGADMDAAWQITRDWDASVQASYAHSQVEGSSVPCNITGAGGQPVFNSGGLISLCPGGSASRLPLWNLTLQSEYSHPIRDGVDGFIRGLFNYYPQNKYIEPTFAAPSYGLLNLYAGVRSPDGAWEASIFARNALGVNKQLDEGQEQLNIAGLLSGFPTLNHPSGYVTAQSTPQREVGVSVRYAFGSR